MNIIIGLLAGVAASMGFGGGFILILYLTAFAGLEQAAAQGINILFFIPVAAVSLIFHAKNKLVDWRTVLPLIPGGLIGVIAGSLISANISVELLRKLFASLMIFVGVKETFHRSDKRAGGKTVDISRKM